MGKKTELSVIIEDRSRKDRVWKIISKLDLCEGGSFSPTIFNSDIELSVFPIWCFISVCPFVTFSKAMFAENVHIVLSSL